MSCAGSHAVGGEGTDAMSDVEEAGEGARQKKGEGGLLYALSFNVMMRGCDSSSRSDIIHASVRLPPSYAIGHEYMGSAEYEYCTLQ